jgi:hypothetical protein
VSNAAIENHSSCNESKSSCMSIQDAVSDKSQPLALPLSPLVMDKVSTKSTLAPDDPWENHSYDNSDGNNASSWPSSNSMGMKDMLEPPTLPELD